MAKRKPIIPNSSPKTLLMAGRTAIRKVPKLRGFVFRGFIINYVISIITAAVIMGGFYYLILLPASAGLDSWVAEGGFFISLIAPLLRGLVWLANLLLMAGSLIFSFLFSMALMSLWYEALAGRIVHHWRKDEGQIQEPEFSVGGLVTGVWRSLWESVGLLVLALLALVLGFIPVVGPFLVFVVDAYLVGWEVRNPYLVVREPLEESVKGMRRGLKLWTVKAGSLPVFLAMVPFVGWLALPGMMIYLVAGTAWLAEEARKNETAEPQAG